MAILVLFLIVIGVIVLAYWANSGKEETKEENNTKVNIPNGHTLPNTSNFEEIWNNYHKAEKETEIRYLNRPFFPTVEKKQVEVMYNYLIKNPNCTIEEMINWIERTFKETPLKMDIEDIYYKWLNRGVLPFHKPH